MDSLELLVTVIVISLGRWFASHVRKGQPVSPYRDDPVAELIGSASEREHVEAGLRYGRAHTDAVRSLQPAPSPQVASADRRSRQFRPEYGAFDKKPTVVQ